MDQGSAAAKKIVIGHKILNLEELFTISTYDSTQPGLKVEVVVDSQLYSDLSTARSKETSLVRDYRDFECAQNLNKSEARAILLVKLV